MLKSKKLMDFIQNPNGAMAYFTLDQDFLDSYNNNKIMSFEDNMKLNEEIGNPFHCGFDILGEVKELITKTKVIKETSSTFTKKIYLETPLGEKGWQLTQMKNTLADRISKSNIAPVETREDFALYDWFYECVKKTDFSTFIKNTKNCIKDNDGKFLPGTFICPPFEILYWSKREDLFFLYFDYPDEFNNAMNKIVDAYGIMCEVAKEAGLKYIAYGAPGGTEFTSPDIWRDAIVPSSIKLEKHIKDNDLYSSFHCCGKISTIIRAGYLNDINPRIYETLSTLPPGDVTDLREMRNLTSKSIITHGNIDLTFLRDATTEQVKKKVYEILEETKGFPHLIGAGDACLWPNTPIENIKVVLDLLN